MNREEFLKTRFIAWTIVSVLYLFSGAASRDASGAAAEFDPRAQILKMRVAALTTESVN